MGIPQLLQACLPCGAASFNHDAAGCRSSDDCTDDHWPGASKTRTTSKCKESSVPSRTSLAIESYNAGVPTVIAERRQGNRGAASVRERQFQGHGTRPSMTDVGQLRRLSVAVAGSEHGAALQLQRLCDLLRAKLFVSFACVDVFSSQRSCSCTLAASGCAEEDLVLAVPRLCSRADAAELRVLLPPACGNNAAPCYSQSNPSLSGGGGGPMPPSPLAGAGSRRGDKANGNGSLFGAPGSPCAAVAAALPAAAAGNGGSSGGGGDFARTSTPAHHPCQPSPPPQPRCVGSTAFGLSGMFQERWSSQASAQLYNNHQRPPYTDRWSSPSVGNRALVGAVTGTAFSDRGSPGGGAAAAAAARGDRPSIICGSTPGPSTPRPSTPQTQAPSPRGCNASLESLPAHIRRLAEEYDTEMRSFWAVPLLAPPQAGAVRSPSPPDTGRAIGSGPAVVVPAFASEGSAPLAAIERFPPNAGGAGGEGREVVGMLYLAGGDEKLFQRSRDTLYQFCRWLADAVSEGRLQLLVDLADCLAQAAGPEAALEAAAAHLSDFFTHRTQGMAEVLAYPAFLPRDSQGRAVIMLPPAANRLVEAASSGGAAAPANDATANAPAPPAVVGGAVALSVASLTGRAGAAAAAAAATAPLGSAVGGAAAAGGAQPPSTASLPYGPLSGWGYSSGVPLDRMALQPFALRSETTLLHAALAAGASRGQALQHPAGCSHSSQGGGGRPATDPPTPQCQRAASGVVAAMRRSGDFTAGPEAARTPRGAYPDVRLLPGRPRHVLVGVLRGAAEVTAAAEAEAAVSPGAVHMGLYLSFSESLRHDLIRELQNTLDALMVLLANTMGSTFGAETMRPQLKALLLQARDVTD